MINIGQSFGGLSVYFIRWNPDNYKPAKGKTTETIKKRHKLCGDLISDIKTNKTVLPNAFISAIYLYYDGWSRFCDEKWEIMMNYDAEEVIV